MYLYNEHPEIIFVEKKKKNYQLPFRIDRNDGKWAQNLARLMSLCNKYSQIDFTYVLAKFLARELEKDKRHWPLIHALKKALKFIEREIQVRSIRIRFIGKLRGARRSRTINIQSKWPTTPCLTLKNEIFISAATAHTVYGSVGIKVMLWKQKYDI